MESPELSTISEKLAFNHIYLREIMNDLHRTVHDNQKSKNLLAQLQEVLLNHFRLQNEALYEEMLSFFEQDHETLKLLEFLRENLKQLKYQTVVFFDAYDIHKHKSFAGHYSAGLHVYLKEVDARVIAEETYLMAYLVKMNA